jgi:hypothetical protein
MEMLLQNERPTVESAKSVYSAWTEYVREIERRVAELERRKPVMTRYTYGKGVEEGFRALDAIELRN